MFSYNNYQFRGSQTNEVMAVMVYFGAGMRGKMVTLRSFISCHLSLGSRS